MRSAAPARATSASQANVSAEKISACPASVGTDVPNCGSRLVKNTAIFGLPRLLRNPARTESGRASAARAVAVAPGGAERLEAEPERYAAPSSRSDEERRP